MRSTLVLLAALALPLAATASGPEKKSEPAPAAKKDAAFCSTLDSYLTEAKTSFASLRTAVVRTTKPKFTSYEAKTNLSGAKKCSVFTHPAEGGDDDFVSCDFVETNDADLAFATFQVLTVKVRACLPGKEWVADSGKHEDGGGEWFELRRADEKLPFLEVDLDHDVDDGSNSVSMDVISPR